MSSKSQMENKVDGIRIKSRSLIKIQMICLNTKEIRGKGKGGRTHKYKNEQQFEQRFDAEQLS